VGLLGGDKDVDLKKIAIPLVVILAVSAVAIPFMGGFFADEDGQTSSSSATDEPASRDGDAPSEQTPSSDASDEPAGPPVPDDPSDESFVSDLLAGADPASESAESIRSRLSPLTSTQQEDVEPLDTPDVSTLYQAVLLHPAHSQQDLHYVESLQPLPPDLDRALAQIVAAHAVSTELLSQPSPPPGASLQTTVTMATVLDSTMPTLERYQDHHVWDRSSSTPTQGGEDETTYTLEAPSLDEALLNLYSAMGLPDSTVNQLAPQVQTAVQQLPEAHRGALARLVHAQSVIQQETAQSLMFIAMPASTHEGVADQLPDEPPEDAPEQPDPEQPDPEVPSPENPAPDDTPEPNLDQLQDAIESLRAAADDARQTIEESPPGEQLPVGEPWTDPLGLIVVGTEGDDRFDASLGGSPETRETAGNGIDALRETAGTVGANTSELTGSETNAEATVTADNGSALPGPGWHMLVLDAGGDDTYVNNAGGIAAGRVLVNLDGNAADPTEPVRSTVFEGGESCALVCAPDPVGLRNALELGSGVSASQGPTPVGVPLTAAVVDLGGDDEYKDTGRVIQGAAEGLAVGVLLDAEGDDRYNASRVAQGAAQQYGYGLLLDGGGDDTYNATARAQGWTSLPSPEANATAQVPFSESDDATAIPVKLARFSESALIDVGGQDTYELENLLTGQGIVETDIGALRSFGLFGGIANQLTTVERSTATFVDAGGDQSLPVPVVEQDRGDDLDMPPSRFNTTATQGHLWLQRPVPIHDAGARFDEGAEDTRFRYKTAAHVNRTEIPDPESTDTIRLSAPNATFYPCNDRSCFDRQDNTVLQFVSATGSVAQGTDLLLFGEPERVQSTPALTITFGGDTLYTGKIASSTSTGQFRSSVTPEVVLDLAGDDTYRTGNRSLGYVETLGSALLVDRNGTDTMVAHNRSIASVEARNVAPRPVAAVLDMDGNLTARSDRYSQGYALESNPGAPGNPATALFDLGANDEMGQGGATLEAGNASQGFATSEAVAVLVGSNGHDTYRVDGWGQGVYDGGGGPVCVNETREGSSTTISGLGLVFDPDGSDTYELESRVGQGDARPNPDPCNDQYEDPKETSDQSQILGWGMTLDVRGPDTYGMPEVPQRPDSLADRACSGANRTECRPSDDQAWTVYNQARYAGDHTVSRAFIIELGDETVQGPGTLGIGVDNVRNVHHLAATVCRGSDVTDLKDSGFGVGPYVVDNGADALRNNAGEEGAGDAFQSIGRGECDEFVRAVWEAYLGPAVADNLPLDRTPELKLSLPRPGAPVTGPTDEVTPEDELPGGDELGVQPLAPVTDPDPTEDTFLESAGQPNCQDRQFASEVTSTRGEDMACLSVTREIALGQWVTANPRSDPQDPGDTIGCNCSASLEIRPDQNATARLTEIGDEGLYPDIGRVTMLTESEGSWYDAHARFRLPVSVQGLIQDNSVNLDPRDRVSSAADFPIDLSQMPSGLASVEIQTVVEGVASEESGGLVPETARQWDRTLVHERSFERAILSETGDDNAVLVTAPGPVDPSQPPELSLAADAGEDVRDELEDLDWERTSEGNFTHDLPDERVIDGPTQLRGLDPISTLTATHGEKACAAALLEAEKDEEGVCWTGSRFVVALPLGDVTADDVEAIAHAGDVLDESVVEVDDPEPEPGVEFVATEDGDPIDYEVDGFGDEVRGLPGEIVLDQGSELATELAGERVTGEWAKINVRPTETNGTIGIEAETRPDVAQRCDRYAPCKMGSDKELNHTHEPVHRLAGSGQYGHAHVAVIGDGKTDQPTVTSEQLRNAKNTAVKVIACANLEYASQRSVQDLLDPQGKVDDNSCVTFAEGNSLVYLVPLGTSMETRLLEFSTQLLRSNGERVTKNVTAHIDSDAPRGRLTVQPTTSGNATRTIQLTGKTSTLELPRLTNGESDLVDIGFQARVSGTWVNWTDPTDETGPWDDLPTNRFPSVEAELNLTRFFNQTRNETIDLRGTFTDESNNTGVTPALEAVLDRNAPDIDSARVLTSGETASLVLDVDESLRSNGGFACAQRGCPVDVEETIPGAKPEAFLVESEATRGTRTIQVPMVGFQSGPTYNVSLELTDPVGNSAIREISVDTTSPVQVDLEPMNGTLINRTATVEWSTRTLGSQTLSTRTSAYLMLPNGPCPVVQSIPGVVSGAEPLDREVGPVSVRGETGERACQIEGEAVNTTLLLYSIVPSVDALALDEVPVLVDTSPPEITIEAPNAWQNTTATAEIASNDTLPTELDVFVDGTPRDVGGETAEIAVASEGVHTVLAEARDRAGNVGANATEIRIDRTSPSVSADVVGIRGGLALVNVTADDALSGVKEVRLLTESNRGPPATGIGETSVLLSTPVESGEDQVVVRASDQARNERDVRLPLDDVPQVTSGPLVQDLELTTPAPDTLGIQFTTTESATPIVIVDAGDSHVERGLDSARDHELTIDELPPGRQAQVTVAMPQNASIEPAANATTRMPVDQQPPSAVSNLQAEATEDGIQLNWRPATDNVGVERVMIKRNGQEITRTSTPTYVDDPDTFDEHSYEVAALDLAGNRGPWRTVEATPQAGFDIVNLTTEPANPTPEDPITVTTTVQTPAGLAPDIVTLEVAGNELPMKPADIGTFTSTYTVTTQMPALDVTSGDTDLVVQAVSGDKTETARFPAPVVAQTQPGGPDSSPDEIPGAGVTVSIALLGAVAIASRRWIE
jgi:hypothetical protein